MSNVNITIANATDLSDINEIYNYYVLNSTCTYQTEPESLPSRQEWFAQHQATHPVTVAKILHNGQNILVGWGSLSSFHRRQAFNKTVENSVYVHHEHLHQGIGKALLIDLLARAKAIGHHTVIAAIDSSQSPSIALHSKLGFKPAGQLKEAGFKFNRWLDIVYLQLMI